MGHSSTHGTNKEIGQKTGTRIRAYEKYILIVSRDKKMHWCSRYATDITLLCVLSQDNPFA